MSKHAHQGRSAESAGSEKVAVLVAGAPRSGTSAVSNVLSELGVDFGKPEGFVDPATHTHNPIFFELASLNALNEEVLGWFGHNYADFDFLPLQQDFTEDLFAHFLPRCAAFLREEFGEVRLIGLKDPRFCFLMPLWQRALTELGYRVRHVWALRTLEAVVASNERVNVSWARNHNIRIATLSMLAAAYFLDGTDCLRLDYDRLLAEPKDSVRKVSTWLGSAGKDLRMAEGVINGSLRKFNHHAEALPDWVSTLRDDALGGTLGPGRYADLVTSLRDLGISSSPRAVLLQPTATSLASQDFAQLFWRDADANYDPARSVSLHEAVQGTSCAMSFQIPEGVHPAFLRFDPSNAAGAFHLRELLVNGNAVADIRDRVRGVNRYVLGQLGNEGIWFASNDEDPWIELEVKDQATRNGPMTVQLSCERRPLESVLSALLASVSDDFQQHVHASVTSSLAPVVGQLSSIHDGLLGRVETLQARGGELEQALATAREHESKLQQTVDALQAHGAQLESKLVEQRESEATALREAFLLSAKLVKIQEQLDAANGRSADLEARHAELEAQNTESQSRIAQLESKLVERRESETRALWEAFWLSAKSVQVREQLDSVQGRLAELEGRHAALTEQLCNQQTFNSTLQAELAEIKSSTLWRALVRMRGVLLKIPRGPSLLLRRGMKLTWWVLTPWRMPARIRFMRARTRAGRGSDR